MKKAIEDIVEKSLRSRRRDDVKFCSSFLFAVFLWIIHWPSASPPPCPDGHQHIGHGVCSWASGLGDKSKFEWPCMVQCACIPSGPGRSRAQNSFCIYLWWSSKVRERRYDFRCKIISSEKYWLKIIEFDKGYIFWKDSPLEVNEFGMTMLLVVFCCSLYPQQVQTKMKQFDNNKLSKASKNQSKLIRRASKIEAWGLLGAILAPRQLRTTKMTFLGRSGPPQKEPF